MNEWVSINDGRKPEDGEKCLVYIKDSYGMGCKIAAFSENLYDMDSFYFMNKRRSGFYDYSSEWGYYEVTDVTHWMSLPEDPKEG